VFNKKRNDDRDRPVASLNEATPEPAEATIQFEPDPAPAMSDIDNHDVISNGNGNGNGNIAKPIVNNLKPSIISEGFEFIGEIRSSGYLTIDGTVRGTLSLHSIQIGVSGVLDGNVSCDTMNVKGNFSGLP
jgi:hypothetical protein